MEFINNLKEKIKQVGIDSKKYLADPKHPYHEAHGFLKAQIICGYISILLFVFLAIYLINIYSKVNVINGMKYLGGIGFLTNFVLIYCIIVYLLFFIFVIVFLNKLVNKKSDFLLFCHKVCAIFYVIYFILMFIEGFISIKIVFNSVFRLFWMTIFIVLLTLYYCTSVKVRVYFGGDDFLKKDHYIHFLLDDKNINETKSVVATQVLASNESVQNNISINENPIINNADKTKSSNADVEKENIASTSNDIKDSLPNNENKEMSDIGIINERDLMNAFNEVQKENDEKYIDTKQQNATDKNLNPSAKLTADLNKKVVTKQVKYENDNNVNTRVDNSHRIAQKSLNKKPNTFVRFLKSLLSAIIKLLLLIVVVFTLINFNSKYKVSEAPFFKNIFTTIDNVTSNLFAHKNVSMDNANISNNEMQTKNVQASNSGVDEDLSNKEIKNDNKNTFSKEPVNNNIGMVDETASSINRIEKTEKKSRNAVKLSTNIKKTNLKGAKWQFNNKQNAWNLIINNKVSKNVIYIIDYTNPITGEPCSSTYGFDPNGKMIVGWGIDESNNYYYFDDNTYDIGKMCTGWKKIDGREYYFESNGRLLTDAITPDGKHVDINGLLVTKTNDMNNNLKNANDLQLKDYNHSTR